VQLVWTTSRTCMVLPNLRWLAASSDRLGKLIVDTVVLASRSVVARRPRLPGTVAIAGWCQQGLKYLPVPAAGAAGSEGKHADFREGADTGFGSLRDSGVLRQDDGLGERHQSRPFSSGEPRTFKLVKMVSPSTYGGLLLHFSQAVVVLVLAAVPAFMKLGLQGSLPWR